MPPATFSFDEVAAPKTYAFDEVASAQPDAPPILPAKGESMPDYMGKKYAEAVGRADKKLAADFNGVVGQGWKKDRGVFGNVGGLISDAGKSLASTLAQPGDVLSEVLARTGVTGAINAVSDPVQAATKRPAVLTPKGETLYPATPGLNLGNLLQYVMPAKGLGAAAKLGGVGTDLGELARGGEAGASAGTPIRPSPTPAELKVGGALHKNLERAKTTPDEVIATLQKHPDRPAFHAGGENMIGYAKAVAREPGPGRDILTRAVKAHQRATPAQIKSMIGEAIGGRGDYLEQAAQLMDQRRQQANTVMSQIGDLPVTIDPDAITALRSAHGKAAIDKTADTLLASVDPEKRNAGAFLRHLHDNVLDNPGDVTVRIRDAQEISRALLNGADRAFKSGDNALGLELKATGRAVRTNAADPAKGGHAEYGRWLKQYGHDSENMEAFELGRDAVGQGKNNTAEAIKRKLDEMSSPVAKDHYRQGLAEGLLLMVRSAKGGVGAMRDLLKSEEFRDKVHLAFPNPDAYDAFIEAAEERVAEADRSNRVLKGSDSFENLAAREDMEGQGTNWMTVAKRGAEAIHSPLKAGARAAENAIDAQIKKSGLLTDPETNELLARALSDPRELERLLRATDPATLKTEPFFNKPSALAADSVLGQALNQPPP